MTSIIVFISGLIFGSFLSVIFHRLEIDEKSGNARLKVTNKNKGSHHQTSKQPATGHGLNEALFGRSACDHCGQQLHWYDNVPVVSYLVLRGRCRHCHQSISQYHPVLELCTALFILATYLAYGFSNQFFVTAFFGLVLLLLFAYDLKHQLVPDVIVVPAIVVALAVVLLEYGLQLDGQAVAVGAFSTNPLNYLLGGAVVGGFFLILSLLSKGTWVGGGDIKLGLLIGLLLGWPYALVALFLAYLIRCFYAVVLLSRRQAGLKSYMPFGPMLVMGWLVVTFHGDLIVDWYNDLVLF